MLSTKRTCAHKLKTIDTFEPCTFQVDAARRGGRLQAGQPLLKRPWSHLLLILCVLHQVCGWHFLGSFHALSGVSTMTNLLVNCTSLCNYLGFTRQKWSLHICAAAASEGGWFSVTCKCVCVCRFAGYDTGACKQPAPVVYTLKLLIGAAPVAFIVTGLMILLLYPISEDVRLRNKVCLDELR